MRLDSVRDLKASLTGTLLAPLAMAAAAPRSLNISTRRVSDAAGLHRTIALGVAPGARNDFRLAVRVQRRAMEQSRELETIERHAHGEVDVRYVGQVVKRAVPWHLRRNRPLRIGGSIGHVRVTAGTLGCFVRDRTGGAMLILSNNHVLADENRAKAGDPIIQPGDLDGGKDPVDRVGTLERFTRLKRAGANLVDCAVCTVDDKRRYSPRQLTGLGRLAGVGPEILDEREEVAKIGRTTGVTRGRVTAFEIDNLIVAFDVGDLRFDNQIEIENAGDQPFSDGGDSGSLIVTSDLHAIGLLFSGSDQGGADGQGLTFANPLRPVLDALKVELLY
jgi:hypothetical protein